MHTDGYIAVESFRRCPAPGCPVRVWGPTKTENHCRAHGGNPLDLMEIVEDDCWGQPITDEAPPPASSPAVPAIHLGLIED